MKSFLIAIFLFSIFVVCRAQQPRVIQVEDLKPPAKLLYVYSYQEILEGLIQSDSTSDEDMFSGKTITPKFNIIAKSNFKDSLVSFGYHPFFEGMYHAYADHRPFTLSPDMIWLLICQGFSQHVNNNSEKLRHFFVDFKGKTSLVVLDNAIDINNPNSPWENLFPEFSEKIRENTDKGLMETITADFSTTTPISKIASQIILMDAMKSYFEFVVIRIACGIPKVTIEGTPEDWEKVLTKTEALRKYDLDWWVDKMEPVLKKIIDASKGRVDKDFWNGMFKYNSGTPCGRPDMADGWIVKFFPYDVTGNRNNLESIPLKSTLPNEIVKVDLIHEQRLPDGRFKKTPLELWAGFVGLNQNKNNYTLKPEIGWMIRKKDVNGSSELLTKLKSKNVKTDDPMGGLMITVRNVPDELMELGVIHSLTIFFVDDIRIPDEMAKLKIEKLQLHGKVDKAGIDRICLLFPQTSLTINEVHYKDGKVIY